jgi:hypothetical protein
MTSKWRRLQISVTIGATLLFILHLVFPSVKLDAVSVALLFFIVLPWVIPFLKSFELPGGFKIELQDVTAITQKIKDFKIQPSVPKGLLPKKVHISEFSSRDEFERLKIIARVDPNLALAGLRLALERQIRGVAHSEGISNSDMAPLHGLLKELSRKGILPKGSGEGIQATLQLLNKAVHGAVIEPEVADKIVDTVHAHLGTLSFDNLYGPC